MKKYIVTNLDFTFNERPNSDIYNYEVRPLPIFELPIALTEPKSIRNAIISILENTLHDFIEFDTPDEPYFEIDFESLTFDYTEVSIKSPLTLLEKASYEKV